MKLTAIGFVAVAALSLTACSDDDNDEPDVPGVANPGQPSVDNVFSQGLPAEMDGYTFTTNDKGQVTKIEDDWDVVTFEYGTFSRATTYQVVMKSRDKNYPDEGYDIYMQLNERGFVSYALQVYLDDEDEPDTWRFEYNAAGQLTSLKRSESEDDFTITYNSAGDIIKVVQIDEDKEPDVYEFVYTNDTYKTPVANKGNLMLFDEFFEIDMDEMGVAYFAGLLGRSTTNLPMGYTNVWMNDNKPETDNEVYNWEFNAENLPVKFWEGNYQDEVFTFKW